MSSCSTQWRAFGSGLDYRAVYLVAGSLGIAIDRAMLEKIVLMESVVLDYRAEQRESDKPAARKTRHGRQRSDPHRHRRQ